MYDSEKQTVLDAQLGTHLIQASIILDDLEILGQEEDTYETWLSHFKLLVNFLTPIDSEHYLTPSVVYLLMEGKPIIAAALDRIPNHYDFLEETPEIIKELSKQISRVKFLLDRYRVLASTQFVFVPTNQESEKTND